MINKFQRRKASILCLFFSLFFLTVLTNALQAQNTKSNSHKISGTVYEGDSNLTIPGISVVVKGTSNGCITDLDGKYELTVNPTDILVYSYVGYNSQEIAVELKTKIDVRLSVKTEVLDEVVVVGYGVQNKSHLTGSISKVATKGLDEIPVSRADEALIGKVSGVTIQMTDSKVGASPTIRVRGTGSITADASPLVVMDGVVVGSGYLGSIDMNDVESIEVLKDAASAAIYGSRGGSGVIMITTKQGKEGKTKISLNSYYGTKYTPKFKIMPTISEWTSSVNDYYSGKTNPLANQVSYINLLNNETDWTDVMFDGGIIQSYSLSALGGNEKTRFAISGGYLADQGVLLTDNFKKSNFRINLDTKVNKYLEVGGNINAAYTTRRDFAIGVHDAIRQSPWLPLYITADNIGFMNPTALTTAKSGGIGDYAREVYFDNYILPGNTTGTVINSTTNESALAKVLQRNTTINNFKLFTNAYAKINITKDLNFRTSLSADYNNAQTEAWVGTKLITSPTSSFSTATDTHMVNENILSYNKNIGNHTFSGIAGIAWEKWDYFTSSESASGYQFDYITTLNAASTVASATTFKSAETLQSYLSRVNYAYSGKYLVSLSARWDGSSRFGADTKYGFFPAASLGWRISEENFLKDNSTISNLKARLSYGVTGNKDGIGKYDAIARLVAATAVINGVAVTGFNPANIANPELRWEKSIESGAGIDFGFFQNRITLSTDVYSRTSKDLLLNQEIPAITGFSTATVNIGEVKNSGFEIELSARIISSKNFNWTASGNLSHNKNELISFAGASGMISYVDVKRPSEYIALEGNPISSFYGYIYDRDVPNEYLKQPLFPIGATSQDCYVKDISGPNGVPDGIITTDDRTVLGSPYPTLTWGLSNELNYKSFDFSFTLQGSHGAKVRNMTSQYLENQFHANMDYVTTFPDKAMVKEKIYTDYDIQDASFVSLRSLNLGYTLPKSLIHKVGLSKARLYVSGQNLIYLMAKSYNGFNPEGITAETDGTYSPLRGGYQVGSAPIAKAFTCGVNVEF